METIMITTMKLTGRTVAAAMGTFAGMRAVEGKASVVKGAGLFSEPAYRGVVLADGIIRSVDGTVMSRGWIAGYAVRSGGSERPTLAPKAATTAAGRGCGSALGAGFHQTDQRNHAEAVLAADATFSMRAFRGLEPWRERT